MWCQDYVSLIAENKKWFQSFEGYEYLVEDFFFGDSLIGNTAYHKLQRKLTPDSTPFVTGLMREGSVEKKVYVYVLDQEYPIYDFSVEGGDEVAVWCVNQYVFLDVDSISTQLLAGVERRTIHVSDLNFNMY